MTLCGTRGRCDRCGEEIHFCPCPEFKLITTLTELYVFRNKCREGTYRNYVRVKGNEENKDWTQRKARRRGIMCKRKEGNRFKRDL
jgi:hypothetical protein